MPVVLALGCLPDGTCRLHGFRYFWLRYVHGFSPHFHCQKSLRGVNDPRFKRDMLIGATLELDAPGPYGYIYLCGIPPGREPGLHLALAPEPGATARAETYNGLRIAATAARLLEIPALPDGYAGMSRKYTTCCNWQFGVRYYGLANLRRELVRD